MPREMSLLHEDSYVCGDSNLGEGAGNAIVASVAWKPIFRVLTASMDFRSIYVRFPYKLEYFRLMSSSIDFHPFSFVFIFY